MDNYDKALEKALKLLKIRSHGSQELQRKLVLKGFNKETALAVTDHLAGTGLINDAEYARNFLMNLIKYKTFGFYMLKAKLMQRGIDRELINELLLDFSLEDEKAIALKLVERKKEIDPVRLARSLSSKGFRTEVIKNILENYKSLSS